MHRITQLVVASCLSLHGVIALAVTTAGAGSTIAFPVVAATGSYTSEISVFYPGPFSGSTTSITINVYYFDANNVVPPATPGEKPCASLAINAGETKSFLLASQCTLGAGNHFGLLGLQDASAEQTNYFFAFNRTESTGTHQGFSIEGFPIGNFSAQTANVSGLKRVAAFPGFDTNCFVGSLGEPVDYQLEVRDSTGVQIGSTLSGSLGPYQLFRYSNIFAAVGAAAGDYTNARARFFVTTASAPALIGFCTVQDNFYFGADFRIAKSRDAADNGQRRVHCNRGNADCTDVGATPFQITDATKKDGFRLLVRPPDLVKCAILGSDASNLELALLPAGPFDPGGTILPGGGGPGQHSFLYDTGEKGAAVNGGIDAFFNLEIQTIASPSHGAPYNYAIRCDSGNGTGNSGRVNTGTLRGF